MKNILLLLAIIIVIGGASFGVYSLMKPEVTNAPTVDSLASSTPATSTLMKATSTVMGMSSRGAPIVAHHFGTGTKELLLIGGIHGGYEWNTTLLANEMIAYMRSIESTLPANISVTIIPALNPDGLSKVVANSSSFTAKDVTATEAVQKEGRFNARGVDLNRNFDCDWKAKGMWQSTEVSGGASAFSEPESQAIKAYVEAKRPASAVVWYSSAGGVYSSSCGGDVLAQTSLMMDVYAKASGYPNKGAFTSYEVSGDMTNWFAKLGIPTISVLLTTHTDSELSKNKAGIDALLKEFSK
jgi:hypothetical protein